MEMSKCYVQKGRKRKEKPSRNTLRKHGYKKQRNNNKNPTNKQKEKNPQKTKQKSVT